MNINDVTEEIEIPKTTDEIWQAIFKKQNTLADKYVEIEGMGNLLETTDNNINTAKGQKWIKDFAWRVTEELGEAWEAFEMAEAESIMNGLLIEQFKDHFKEELADALHFLTELTIIAGYGSDITQNLHSEFTYQVDIDTPESLAWVVVYQMGLMCNTLKNKPWKQTQMLTDKVKFERYLKATWETMINLLGWAIGDEDKIYLYYFKKNKVNQFRQRSNY